ncbi:MAG: nicotinamide mononucleotide transporter [Phaeodactylibacter sp.]|nr:nicotinamide mononucleotide transporter [Phaeodactylibacter sp.]MCB9294955.1 nicotinamide mononucleotide transporter [Lewinellaceae bacterium]
MTKRLLQTLLTEAAALSWVDWVVTVTALIYVVLAARENVWCWFWGIISCSLWAYASFAFYDLYLDALLQLFYVAMAVVGLYQWKYGGQAGEGVPISRLSARQHLYILVGGTAAALLFGYFFDEYTPAAATYWDAFTTVFSVIATLILVRKILDNWAYWIVVDLVYVGLYFSRGAYLFALVMVVYVVIASFALVGWRRQYRAQV